MFVPRLVATDLDGTLLRSDGSVSDRTLVTLSRLERLGIELVFVTGRPVRWLDPVLAITGRRGTVVCANGAIIADGQTAAIIKSWTIAPTVLRAVTSEVRARLPAARFAVEREPEMVCEQDYPVRFSRPTVVGYDDLVGTEAYKLLVRVPGAEFDQVWQVCAEVTGGRATPTHSGSHGLVEISAEGVTKATGLAWAAARFGIPPEAVIAFGDMPNDLPMLRWVGLGVAVGDAHPEVLAAAGALAPANDADGVAAYLDELLDAL
jgi:hypothetical protein